MYHETAESEERNAQKRIAFYLKLTDHQGKEAKLRNQDHKLSQPPLAL
jgi:hypothetical protein